MTTVRLVVLATVLALALVALPGDAFTGDASAQSCTPYLAEADTKGYVGCVQRQCNWTNGRPVCTD